MGEGFSKHLEIFSFCSLYYTDTFNCTKTLFKHFRPLFQGNSSTLVGLVSTERSRDSLQQFLEGFSIP